MFRDLLNVIRYQWHLTACPKDGGWVAERRAWRCITCRYRRHRTV